MRTASIAASLATLAVLLPLSQAPRAQETPILSAMRDEMARSMADLRMKGEPAPYYIEYEIDDISSMRAIARTLLSRANVGVVGSKILYPDGKTIQHAGGIVDYPLATTAPKEELQKLTGACSEANPESYLRIRDYLLRLR